MDDVIKELNERFRVKIYGLSADMEDFIFEQNSNYSVDYHKFYTSFYEICVDMQINNVDLTDKQLTIIEREYNKVIDERKTSYEIYLRKK